MQRDKMKTNVGTLQSRLLENQIHIQNIIRHQISQKSIFSRIENSLLFYHPTHHNSPNKSHICNNFSEKISLSICTIFIRLVKKICCISKKKKIMKKLCMWSSHEFNGK